MKTVLEINSKIKLSLSKKYFEKVIAETIKLSKIKNPGIMEISLAFVSEEEIKKINRIYRRKNEVTDVLSFSEFSPGKKVARTQKFFCELIVCPSCIKKYSRESKISFKKEMAYVVSHGMLHCLGWKHSREMYKVQDKICEKFK